MGIAQHIHVGSKSVYGILTFSEHVPERKDVGGAWKAGLETGVRWEWIPEWEFLSSWKSCFAVSHHGLRYPPLAEKAVAVALSASEQAWDSMLCPFDLEV
jgi:hypothetical protein